MNTMLCILSDKCLVQSGMAPNLFLGSFIAVLVIILAANWFGSRKGSR